MAEKTLSFKLIQREEYEITSSGNEVFSGDEVDVARFINLTNKLYELRIYFVDTNGVEKYIDPTNPLFGNLTVASFDNTVRLHKSTNGYAIYALREGTAYLRAYFTDNDGDYIVADNEIVIYDNFFTTNYKSFFSLYDKSLLESNKQMEALLYTCMEFFDIIYAYCADIKHITNPINVKWKMLTMLGESYGFQRMTFPDGSDATEHIGEYMYRELLSNLVDLLEVRGTQLSYDLFFNALGYDIKLNEFWYDENGRLVNIDPYTENNSTFEVYDTTGLEADASVLTKDPRSQASTEYAYNICNKSHYIQPVYTQKSKLPTDTQQQQLLQKYLEFLRPTHIAYLLTTNHFWVGADTDNVLFDLIEPEFPVGTVNYNTVGFSPQIGEVGTTYIDESGTEFDLGFDTDRAKFSTTPRHKYETLYDYKGLIYKESDLTASEKANATFVAGGNSGDSDYDGVINHKVWEWETGGFVAEHYKQLSDDFIFSTPIEIVEKWQEIFKYNSASIIEAQEKYNRDYQPAIDATNMVIGRKYQIVTIGSLDFTQYAKEYITGSIGDIFTCTAVPTTTGATVYALNYRNKRLLDTSNDKYTYGNSGGLQYDVGTFLSDDSSSSGEMPTTNIVNVTDIIKSMKAWVSAGYSANDIITLSMSTYSISHIMAVNVFKMI